MGNWVKRAASPFGDPEVSPDTFSLKAGKQGAALHPLWRKRRARYQSIADRDAPFRYQGLPISIPINSSWKWLIMS